ncbi:LysR family transcriptional regulator [Duganella aceris]|uniref:LysR family transcriptional regulator n=1 Tax=Duganella aceris TaxID=2703883 RepID=A0ABX0FKE9_9BURK|nr:LysR family transcriptional regulator [Duganella aceris]NGZ85059.1 LysR family transcriptional regulator [Duganella aceris]
MDSLSGISIFVRVAEIRSFTEAGRLLGVSSSAVGKSIARIEERLKVRLFHRSTRSITLTTEGALFLDRCRRILSEVEAAENELSNAVTTAKGKLRISLPQLTSFLMPVLERFIAQHPEIELDIDLSDRMVDVIEEGFDLVVRTGDQPDSRLISRRLGTFPQVLVGAASYFKKHGIPRRPGELSEHACLLHRFHGSGKLEPWPLHYPDGESVPVLPVAAISNTIEAVSYLAQKGRGIALLPIFMVSDGLDSGELLTVLDEYMDQNITVSMLWPETRYASPKLRVFIDYLGQNLGN